MCRSLAGAARRPGCDVLLRQRGSRIRHRLPLRITPTLGTNGKICLFLFTQLAIHLVVDVDGYSRPPTQ